MRSDVQKGYHAVRGSTPTFDHESIVDEVVAAFKQGKRGVNFRNARPYVVSGYRGQKIYFCDDRAWNKGIEALGDNLRNILAPQGYVNEGLAGHDQYYDLASKVAYRLNREVL
jgi:hypothetical protein